MYYSYVEFEYVATSFSPARTDLALCLGHFEFKTLLRLSSAFSTRPNLFLYRTIQSVVRAELAQASLFSATKKFLHSANLQATIQVAGFPQVPPKVSFKKLLLGTGLWYTSKWLLPSSLPTRWRMLSARKGSWATGHPSHTYLRRILSRPRKNLNWCISFLENPLFYVEYRFFFSKKIARYST